MTTFAGYVEAQCTVPTGVTLSVVVAAGSASIILPANDYYPSEICTQLSSALNSDPTVGGPTWTVTQSVTTGKITIANDADFALRWDDTNLRDLLGFTADLGTYASTWGSAVGVGGTSTGTKQCRGLWIPDCPVTMDQDPRMAPEATDLRTTTSPTGTVYALIGNVRYRHTNVKWSHVTADRVVEGLVTTANASWQFFFRETQFGLGLSWFRPSSRLRIICHDNSEVGSLGNSSSGVVGWWITGIDSIAPKKVNQDWHGLYAIELPELVSDG